MFKQGATDCTAWPVDLTRLATLIDVFTVRHQRNIGGIAAPKPDSRMPHRTIAGFLFVTRDTRAMYDQIEAAAQSDCTILLTGETGTGKSHAARCIHELSPRRNKPFQVVECGGLSSALLESELFGHQRGSFTGADRNHEGKFAAVEDGTILLDEIDCVPLEAQAKLLRVFEDRVFEAVGSNRTSDFRGRLIAATNQPLDQQVAAKAFRSDLFFRLKVVEFRLPPLRDCPEAIEALAENFLRTFGQRLNRELRGIAPAALEALRAYHWPGNIRELRNTVERVLTLSRRDWLDLPDLPREIRSAVLGIRHVVSAEADESRPNELASARERGELHRLLQALSTHDNNRTRAAKELGISRVALYKKLRKFGIQQPLC
jgi:DNA-binding NtrC family response regulator